MYVIYPNLDFWFKNLPTIWQPCIWKRKKMAAFSGQKNVERMRLLKFLKIPVSCRIRETAVRNRLGRNREEEAKNGESETQ
jgi:hypothetical protein